MSKSSITALNFEDFYVPKGSFDEALLVNSPDDSNVEDLFLSKYTVLKKCFAGSVEEKLSEWEKKSNVLATIPDSFEELITHAIDDLEEVESSRSLRDILKGQHEEKRQPPKKQLDVNINIDQYGFFIDPAEQEAMQYLYETPKQKGKDIMRIDKLAQFITQWDNLSEDRKRKLKQRMKKGIPNRLRGDTWMKLARVGEIRDECYHIYKTLQNRNCEYSAQIHRDLPRSLPRHVFFQESGGDGQRALFEVLNAYAQHDSKVGYCQGMGFIAAVFLIYVPPEDSFCLLRRLLKDYEMSGLFEPGFPKLFKCFHVHQQLLQSFLPRLSNHLNQQGVVADMYAMGWYTTLYVNSLRFPYIIRIFDMFFCEGTKVLFRIALAILKLLQKQLLQCNFDEIVVTLKNLDKSLRFAPDELISCAMEFSISKKRLDKIEKEFDSQG